MAMVLARLSQAGERISIPFGDKDRYDLVLDRQGEFKRVQCKTGRLRGDVVRFHVKSVYLNSIGKPVVTHYKGQVDFFGVYCPELDTAYLVPESEVGRNICHLRVRKNGNFRNGSGIRWAKDFEIRSGGRAV